MDASHPPAQPAAPPSAPPRACRALFPLSEHAGTAQKPGDAPARLCALARPGHACGPGHPPRHQAGGKGWFYDAVFAQTAALGLQDAVIFPGYVPDGELPDWYRRAGLRPAQRIRGFGLPVLEALAAAPVLCSDIPACLRWRAKPRCWRPPREGRRLGCELALLASQPELRTDLRRRGPAQAKAPRFTWRRRPLPSISYRPRLHFARRRRTLQKK